MKITFSSNLTPSLKKKIENAIDHFDEQGEIVYKARNIIKLIELDGVHSINSKRYKIPNIINRFAYRWFRKSKAQRAFEYASILRDKGFLTPKPFAYAEERTGLFIKESFYVSEHVFDVYEFREIRDKPIQDIESLLRKAVYPISF